jgi:hypothetical protein
MSACVCVCSRKEFVLAAARGAGVPQAWHGRSSMLPSLPRPSTLPALPPTPCRSGRPGTCLLRCGCASPTPSLRVRGRGAQPAQPASRFPVACRQPGAGLHQCAAVPHSPPAPPSQPPDIWALGCILHELCTLRPLFGAGSDREVGLKVGLQRLQPGLRTPRWPRCRQRRLFCWQLVCWVSLSKVHDGSSPRCPPPPPTHTHTPQVLAGEVPPIPPRYSADLAGLVAAMLRRRPAARPSIDDILGMPAVGGLAGGGGAGWGEQNCRVRAWQLAGQPRVGSRLSLAPACLPGPPPPSPCRRAATWRPCPVRCASAPPAPPTTGRRCGRGWRRRCRCPPGGRSGRSSTWPCPPHATPGAPPPAAAQRGVLGRLLLGAGFRVPNNQEQARGRVNLGRLPTHRRSC